MPQPDPAPGAVVRTDSFPCVPWTRRYRLARSMEWVVAGAVVGLVGCAAAWEFEAPRNPVYAFGAVFLIVAAVAWFSRTVLLLSMGWVLVLLRPLIRLQARRRPVLFVLCALLEIGIPVCIAVSASWTLASVL